MLEQLDIHRQKSEFQLKSHISYTNSKWITDLGGKHKKLNFFLKREKSFFGPKTGKEFLNLTLTVQCIKGKLDILHFIKFRNTGFVKNSIKRIKEISDWEKVFANYIAENYLDGMKNSHDLTVKGNKMQ